MYSFLACLFTINKSYNVTVALLARQINHKKLHVDQGAQFSLTRLRLLSKLPYIASGFEE